MTSSVRLRPCSSAGLHSLSEVLTTMTRGQEDKRVYGACRQQMPYIHGCQAFSCIARATAGRFGLDLRSPANDATGTRLPAKVYKNISRHCVYRHEDEGASSE